MWLKPSAHFEVFGLGVLLAFWIFGILFSKDADSSRLILALSATSQKKDPIESAGAAIRSTSATGGAESGTVSIFGGFRKAVPGHLAVPVLGCLCAALSAWAAMSGRNGGEKTVGCLGQRA